MISDTELLEFLVENGGRLDDNQGHGYLYWYPDYKGHTAIIEGRSFRQALMAAMGGEKGR